MVSRAAEVVASELAKLSSLERPKFLHEMVNHIFAGIVVIEGREAAIECAFMLTESLIQTKPDECEPPPSPSF